MRQLAVFSTGHPDFWMFQRWDRWFTSTGWAEQLRLRDRFFSAVAQVKPSHFWWPSVPHWIAWWEAERVYLKKGYQKKNRGWSSFSQMGRGFTIPLWGQMLNHSQCESLNSKGGSCLPLLGALHMAGIPPILPKKMATPAIQIQSSRLMLLDGRCRVIGVASTLILLIKANGHICETLRKVPEVHPERRLSDVCSLKLGGPHDHK